MDHLKLIIAGMSLGAAAQAPAHAGAPRHDPDAFRVEISTSGLDLTTKDGAKALAMRTRAAARRTCAMNTSASAYDQAVYAACVGIFDDALEAAILRLSEKRKATVGKVPLR